MRRASTGYRRHSALAWAAATILAVLGWSHAAHPAELSVVADELRSRDGAVHLALWDRAEGFVEIEHAIIRTQQPVTGRQVRFELGDLKPGRYAVVIFHDENSNGEFDRTWIGLPGEGLGFSNGAWIGLGPPSFKEAAFELRQESQEVVVSLRYPEGDAVEKTHSP